MSSYLEKPDHNTTGNVYMFVAFNLVLLHESYSHQSCYLFDKQLLQNQPSRRILKIISVVSVSSIELKQFIFLLSHPYE